MAKRITRNIVNTNVGGSKLRKNNEGVEPFFTNNQNDILSDNEDIFIRNNNEYHCLTDDLKTITTDTDRIVDILIERNKVNIDVLETRIDSQDGRLSVKNTAPNKFLLDIDLSTIEDNVLNNSNEISSIKESLLDIESRLSRLEGVLNE